MTITNKIPALDINIERGDDYTLAFTIKDSTGTAINLTGYTGVLELRRDINSTNADSSVSATLGGVAGTFSAPIADAFTLANTGRHYYKVKLTTGSTTTTKLKGVINII